MPLVKVNWTEVTSLSATFEMTDEEIVKIGSSYDDITDQITNLDTEKYQNAVDAMLDRTIEEVTIVKEEDDA